MKLHDAKLVSIKLEPAHVVQIGLVEESGAMRQIVLGEVERMRGLDLKEGNIVLEVVCITGAVPPIEVLRKLFDLEIEECPDFLRTKMAKIEAGELTLVHIVPSYGCELVALCKTFILN